MQILLVMQSITARRRYSLLANTWGRCSRFIIGKPSNRLAMKSSQSIGRSRRFVAGLRSPRPLTCRDTASRQKGTRAAKDLLDHLVGKHGLEFLRSEQTRLKANPCISSDLRRAFSTVLSLAMTPGGVPQVIRQTSCSPSLCAVSQLQQFA